MTLLLSLGSGDAVFGVLYIHREITTNIEERHRCFRLGSYFMAAVLAAASYYRVVFSPCLAISARRGMVPGGIMFHLEPGTIHTPPSSNWSGEPHILTNS